METTTATQSLKAQFDLHTRLFNNATDGITENESGIRKNEHINNIKWIAGHLLNTRLGTMSKIAGLPSDGFYPEQFGKGKAFDPNATYAPLEEIRAKWHASAGAIREGISNIPEVVLASKAPFAVPIADDTMRGAVSFLVSHEAYHIGQLGLLRKMIGKDAMSYS